jgi:hypothetical protein
MASRTGRVDPGVVAVARQQIDRATDAELALRRHQQRRAGWLEANAHLGPAYRQVVRELAWQRRARDLAAEQDPPAHFAPGARPSARLDPEAAGLATRRGRDRGLPP